MFEGTYLEEILITVEMTEKIVLYIGTDVTIPIRYWGIGIGGIGIGGIGRYWYWWYWSVLVLGVGISITLKKRYLEKLLIFHKV